MGQTMGAGEAITASSLVIMVFNFMTNCVQATRIPRNHNLIYGFFSLGAGCALGLLFFWTIVGCLVGCSFSTLGVWHLFLWWKKGVEGEDGTGETPIGGDDDEGYDGLVTICISCFNVPNMDREQNLSFAIINIVCGIMTLLLLFWTICGFFLGVFFLGMGAWHFMAYYRKGGNTMDMDV